MRQGKGALSTGGAPSYSRDKQQGHRLKMEAMPFFNHMDPEPTADAEGAIHEKP